MTIHNIFIKIKKIHFKPLKTSEIEITSTFFKA